LGKSCRAYKSCSGSTAHEEFGFQMPHRGSRE
jgi:hypothetical protein